MNSVLPREEEVEAIFSQILASPDSCKKLMDIFYDVMDDNHLLEADNPKHFSKVLFYAYQNGDISALLLKLCGKSMFDLLREAYLIPKRFHGKAGKNPVLLTNPEGELLPEAQKIVSGREYSKFKETYKNHICAPRSAHRYRGRAYPHRLHRRITRRTRRRQDGGSPRGTNSRRP